MTTSSATTRSLDKAREDLHTAVTLAEDPFRQQQYARAAADYAAEAALTADADDAQRREARDYLRAALALARPDSESGALPAPASASTTSAA